MQDREQGLVKIRTGNKTGIWLALLAALSIHVIILFLPVGRHTSISEPADARIEVQLTAFSEPPEPQEAEAEAEPPPPDVEPEPDSKASPEQMERVAETEPEPQTVVAQAPVLASVHPVQETNKDFESLSEAEIRSLTNSILTRQFITEESVSEQIFGRQILQQPAEFKKEFHYPIRQSMIAMLDQPMQELPFAYTPGLIHFAYDPGVKGDLQRFWDVITPEFGWRTKYGTEVRCIWMLVIVGCGWK